MYVKNFSFALFLVACGGTPLFAQSKEADESPLYRAKAVSDSSLSPFEGTWSYRSFRSNPDLSVPFNDLRFGAGTLKFTHPKSDVVAGTLGGDGWELKLKGGTTYGNPATIRFQGKGVIGDEEWVYDYVVYIICVGWFRYGSDEDCKDGVPL